MQTEAGIEKQKAQSDMTGNKYKKSINTGKKPGVRTTGLSGMIKLIRKDPNSLSQDEFMLFQSAVGYKQATRIIEKAKQNKKLEKEKAPVQKIEVSGKKPAKLKQKKNTEEKDDLPTGLDKLKNATSYAGESIVDYLNSIGVDSSRGNRAKIAGYFHIVAGISDYKATAKQNTKILAALRNYSKSKNNKVKEKSETSAENSKNEASGDTNLVSAAAGIIFGNEGNYASVAKDDNGALSIGKIQWHGTRARDLLKKIRKNNPGLTKNTLTSSIYSNLDSSDEYWKVKKLNNEEAGAISKLLVTAEGKTAQDEQSKLDVGGYINAGKRLGITDNRTLVYFADLYNQSPKYAIKIVEAAGGGKGLSLDAIHKAALANSVMGKYKDRRNKTCSACGKISSGTDKTDPSAAKDNKVKEKPAKPVDSSNSSAIETAVSFMEKIAADDSHGYDQANRTGGIDYDCSSLVSAALIKGGFSVSKASTTRNLYSQLLSNGFSDIGTSAARKRGDIFLKTGHHVVMCTDANNIVHASINENGDIIGGKHGDQTGKEICVRSFYTYSGGWTYHLRYGSGL